jgi:hypothetical protein
MRSSPWFVPLTGVAFIVVIIIGFLVGAEPPDADQPAQEIVDFYVDDKDAVKAGAFLSGVAAVLFLFFAGYLRKALRLAGAETSMLPSVALAGATVIATGAGIDAMISFALAETADNLEPSAVQGLQALWDNDFLPFLIGSGAFLIASGLAIIRYGGLPAWLGWVGVVLGVLAVTPIGFVAFPGGALWILVASILLTLQARAAAAPPPGGPGTATPAP